MPTKHGKPLIMPLSRNAVTTFQVVNLMALLAWAFTLIAFHDAYEESDSVAAMEHLLPDLYWWACAAGVLSALHVLTLIPAWTQRVNRTWRTKYLALLGSVMWWAFIALMFGYATGPASLGTLLHLALCLGSIFESSRLTRRGL